MLLAWMPTPLMLFVSLGEEFNFGPAIVVGPNNSFKPKPLRGSA